MLNMVYLTHKHIHLKFGPKNRAVKIDNALKSVAVTYVINRPTGLYRFTIKALFKLVKMRNTLSSVQENGFHMYFGRFLVFENSEDRFSHNMAIISLFHCLKIHIMLNKVS